MSNEYCLECADPFSLSKKNMTTRICTVDCKGPNIFQIGSNCKSCTECVFCQKDGNPICPRCIQCLPKCEYSISSQLLIRNSNTAYYVIKTNNFEISNIENLLQPSESISLKKVDARKFLLYKKIERHSSKVEIRIDSTHITSTSCIHKEVETLEFEFLKKKETVMGLSIDSVRIIFFSSNIIFSFSQIKLNSAYYLIEYIKKNTLINFLFILNNDSENFLKNYNDFLRSANYREPNKFVKNYFGLDKKSRNTEFFLLTLSSSFKMKENLIQEQELISINEVFFVCLLVLLSVNYFCCFEYFDKVIKSLDLLKANSKYLKK